MESLQNMKDLIEKMSVETNKVCNKGNHSASIRARKYAQEIKEQLRIFRKDILEEMKKHNQIKDKSVSKRYYGKKKHNSK